MQKSILFILVLCASCGSDVRLASDSIPADKYYSSDVIPAAYSDFYGQWKLTSISGGFAGGTHKPTFDYLIIKKFGIYAIVTDDTVTEHGKIKVDTFDTKSKLLQVEFVPDSTQKSSHLATFPFRYVELKKGSQLDLISGCCDAFDHHFQKVR